MSGEFTGHVKKAYDLSTHAEGTLVRWELAGLGRGTILGDTEECDGLLRERRRVVRTEGGFTADHAEIVREGLDARGGGIVIEKIVYGRCATDDKGGYKTELRTA